jgi:hypothetical protein
MTINKMKLFELVDCWPWATVLAIATGVIGLAFSHAYLTTHEGMGVGGWITFLAVLLSFWGITTWRYILRQRFLNSIIGYTANGVGVTASPPTLAKLNSLYHLNPSSILTRIDNDMTYALSWWNGWATTNGKTQQTTEIFNGMFLAIEDQPIQTVYWSQKLAGLEVGGTIAVMWLTTDPADLDPIIKHETGHRCLDAMGIPSDETTQELIMKQAGYNY